MLIFITSASVMVTLWPPEDEPKEDVTDEEETDLEAVSGAF